MTLEMVLGLYNYWIVIFLMMTGFYMVIARRNLVKSIMGLNIFQSSVFLLYITMGKINGGVAPIIDMESDHAATAEHAANHAASATAEHAASAASEQVPSLHGAIETAALNAQAVDAAGGAASVDHPIVYSHPLPSVLMLTAIVVGIATTALALALIVRIREEYGTVDEERILELDRLP